MVKDAEIVGKIETDREETKRYFADSPGQRNFVFRRFSENLSVKQGPTIINDRQIGGTNLFILGNIEYGILGTGKLGENDMGAWTNMCIVNPNDTWIEMIRDTTFNDTSLSTGDWDISNYRLTIGGSPLVEFAWWKMNNNSNDDSGNGNNGADNNMAYGAGKINQAAQFGGVNSWINIPFDASLYPADDMSMTFWVKLSGIPPGNRYIMSNEGNGANPPFDPYYAYVDANRKINVNFEGDNGVNNVVLQTTTQLVVGTWYYLTAVLNATGGSGYLYVNTVQEDSAVSNITNMDTNNLGMHIGCRQDRWGNPMAATYFNGELDDVRLTEQVLTTEQISQLYNSGSGTEDSISGGGLIQTLPICFNDGTITNGKVILYEDNLTTLGGTFAMYLSANGGGSWDIAANNTLVTFTVPGTSLKLRLTQTGGTSTVYDVEDTIGLSHPLKVQYNI